MAPTRKKVGELKKVFGLTLTAADSHQLQRRAVPASNRQTPSPLELLEGFLDTTLPADAVPSRAARARGVALRPHHGMPAALGEFTTAIRRFAEAKGATGLYHETITWAFVLIIAERSAAHADRHLGRVRGGQPRSAGVEAVRCWTGTTPARWRPSWRDGVRDAGFTSVTARALFMIRTCITMAAH